MQSAANYGLAATLRAHDDGAGPSQVYPSDSTLSRPSHNLSGNGRAATGRDTGVTNRDLGASRGATRG